MLWNNISVGIMGVVEDWLDLCAKVSPKEVKYLDLFESAQRCCDDLHARGAEVIIAITHCRKEIDEELSR